MNELQVAVPQFAGQLLTQQALDEYCLTKDISKRDLLNRAFARKFLADNPNLEACHAIEFFHKIQETGANPFFGDIYCIPYNATEFGVKKVKANVMFGYQFLLQKAQETGEYEGYDGPVFREHVENWNPSNNFSRDTATCEVVVYRKGKRPTKYTADFWEFAKFKKDYNTGAMVLQSTWNNWKIMLEKCAVANAIRRAFPDVLRGIYCREEMDDENRRMEMVTVSPPQIQQIQEPPKNELTREEYKEELKTKLTEQVKLVPKTPPLMRIKREEKPVEVQPEIKEDGLTFNELAEVDDIKPIVEKKTPPPKKTEKADRPATNEEMQKIMAQMNKMIHEGHLDYDSLGALQRLQRSYNKLYELAVALSLREFAKVRTLLVQ